MTSVPEPGLRAAIETVYTRERRAAFGRFTSSVDTAGRWTAAQTTSWSVPQESVAALVKVVKAIAHSYVGDQSAGEMFAVRMMYARKRLRVEFRPAPGEDVMRDLPVDHWEPLGGDSGVYAELATG